MNDTIPLILALLLVGVIIGIPVLALSLRFALKPLVEAYTRLKEVQQGGQPRELPVVMQQLSRLEQRLEAIEQHMDRLDEVTEFRRELEKPRG
ncbi:MAG: hypothetical protein P8Z36_05270 [Gemmatimonadota bacterium]